MNILRWIVIVMAVIVAVASAGIIFWNRDADVAPTITCSVEGDIEGSVITTDEELLQLVSASDEQDGDLTEEIQVVRKKYFVTDKTSVVTYSVCDSDNNVTTLQKNIVYTDYVPPELSLKSDFIFQAGAVTGELSSYVTAHDCFDGDLSAYVKLISTEFVNAEGQYPVNMKVSNSMGDTEELTIDAIVINDYNKNVRIHLSKYLLYYDGNPEIDWTAYIESVTGGYSEADVVIDTTELDLTKAGVNNVYFRIVDTSNGKTVSYTRMIVVVKEV